MADRLRRLGRDRGGATRKGGGVRRRALHGAGARSGRRNAVRLCRRAAVERRRMAGRQRQCGTEGRLRSVAARHRLGAGAGEGARREGREPDRGRREPARRGVGRPARAERRGGDRA